MQPDRSLIGLQSAAQTYEVERGAIRRFAEAIGDDTPAFRRGEVAPPTFPATFRPAIEGLAFDEERILHGGEEYEYRRPIGAGDVLSVTRRVADVYERGGRGGRLTFLVLEGEGRDERGDLVYRSRTTLVWR